MLYSTPAQNYPSFTLRNTGVWLKWLEHLPRSR